MRRIALAFVLLGSLLGLGGPSLGGVPCTLPFNLQNNTTADATQVMANYNSLVSCLANAAAAGANSDITSLSGITVPLSPSAGGSPFYIAGTSTGTVNAQIVATTTPSSWSLAQGKTLTFIAGFTNTGAMTLNVDGGGNTPVFRRSQLGVTSTVGGEMIAGHSVTVTFDGAEFQIVSNAPVNVGEMKEFAGSTAPPGWLLTDGSAISRTGAFTDLFAVLGTTYGAGNGSTTFNIPDTRGRMVASPDGGAGRLTSAGSGCNAILGAGCGVQSSAISQAQIPSYNLSTAGLGITAPTINDPGHAHGITDPGHSHSYNQAASNATAASGGLTFFNTQTLTSTNTVATGISINSATTGISANAPSLFGTLPSGGSGSALALVNPLTVVNRIIKY